MASFIVDTPTSTYSIRTSLCIFFENSAFVIPNNQHIFEIAGSISALELATFDRPRRHLTLKAVGPSLGIWAFWVCGTLIAKMKMSWILMGSAAGVVIGSDFFSDHWARTGRQMDRG